MAKEIRNYLKSLNLSEIDNDPVIDYKLFFEGNSIEESIAPNQWGEGRPSINDIYKKLQEIALKPSVDRILVGLHPDWRYPIDPEEFPPAENVHIITSSSEEDVKSWISEFCADAVAEGWAYGEPTNAPKLEKGYKVYSIFWD